MAVVGSLQEFSAQTCSICKQCFDDPVTLDCGHNFCQACLPSLPHWGEPNRDLSCLLCNETVHQRNFKPNQQLGNLAQLFRKLQEGAKRDAERRQVSKSQQDPPRLFCKEDRAPIGTGCKRNKEDKIHGVVPAEVAAQGSKVTQAASPNINATKTPVLGSPTTNEEQETMCSICKEYLRDPVTLDCGHNFCRGCITKYCNIWENQDGGVLECPLCKSQIQKWNFRPNLQLAEIIENLLPLKSYKERSQTQLKSWEKEKQNLVDQKQSEEEEKQKCLKQLNAEKQKIKDAFEQMQNSLKEKESSWLACLRNLEKEIKKEVAENGNRLSEDISYLTNLIAELEKKCEQPPLLFLQDIESTLLRYEEKRAEHSAALSTWLEERLKISCQKNSALVNAMVKCADSLEEALKKEGLNKCHTTAPLEQKLEKVSVTLDPQTAHPLLTLSADLKSVKVGEVPDDEAEDMDGLPYVLGREKFTSGRHWWEVELDLNAEDEEYMDKECLWIIGAAQESFERNRGFDLSPKAMVWAVGVSPFSKKLTAFTSRKPTHLSLAHQVRKIRVSLDYKAGRVEFFDADTNALIFTFSAASFTGEAIRPFFCLGGEGLELKCGN